MELKKEFEILNPKCSHFSEDRLRIKLCANYFSFEKDLYLCLVYISLETSTHQSSRNNIWNLLEEEISKFSITGHILLTGDFNARTGLLPDYVSLDSSYMSPFHQIIVLTYQSQENQRIIQSITMAGSC